MSTSITLSTYKLLSVTVVIEKKTAWNTNSIGFNADLPNNAAKHIPIHGRHFMTGENIYDFEDNKNEWHIECR